MMMMMMMMMMIRQRDQRLLHVEVRDSRAGFLVPGRDGPRALPNGESCWDAVAAATVTWKFRLTFRPGNYIWSFSYGFGVLVRDLGEWRPGFYSEFRYKSREHSGLAWGAILRKVFVLTLVPRLPCSFFQEHVPKMDSFANVLDSKELLSISRITSY